MAKHRKLIVFLCHANVDKTATRKIHERLKSEGWIQPWFDSEDIMPGQDREYEIKKALKSADSVIVCLSKNSVRKEGSFHKEIKIALDAAQEKLPESIFIIPLRLDNCKILFELEKWQVLDYFDSEKEHTRLLRSLELRAKFVGVKNIPAKVGNLSDILNENHPEEVQLIDLTPSEFAKMTGNNLLRVELILGLDAQYIERGVVFVLPRKLNIDAHSMLIKNHKYGDKKIIVELPERATRELELLVKNNDPDLYGLLKLEGIQVLDKPDFLSLRKSQL